MLGFQSTLGGTFLYSKSESSDLEALRIDYKESLSMLVVLPATGRWDSPST